MNIERALSELPTRKLENYNPLNNLFKSDFRCHLLKSSSKTIKHDTEVNSFILGELSSFTASGTALYVLFVAVVYGISALPGSPT